MKIFVEDEKESLLSFLRSTKEIVSDSSDVVITTSDIVLIKNMKG